jgi:hypothetical protein
MKTNKSSTEAPRRNMIFRGLGQDPQTGEQPTRAVKSTESVNNYVEKITTSKHPAELGRDL